MSVDYQALSLQVKVLLQTLGFAVTLSRNIISADQIHNSVTINSTATCLYNCVIDPINMKKVDHLDEKFIDNSFVKNAERIIYASPDKSVVSPLTPEIDDTFDMGDNFSWRVVGVTKITPGNVDILYIIGLVKE